MKGNGNVVVFQIFVVLLCGFSACFGKDLLTPEFCNGIKKIEVYYRDYFDIYLGNNMFMPELNSEGRYVQVLKQVTKACCSNTDLSFTFIPDGVPGTPTRDVEAHLVDYLREKPDGGGDVYRFYYPEFADKKERTIYDSQTEFVRLGSSPGHAILMKTPKPIPPVFVGDIFVKSWAIMIFLITFAWIIGILIWMADHFKNPKEFPNPFYVGMFEGFWWSVVTMTTVGYGDKSPKSNLARVLAVVWIMISTVFLSLFTANATSILTISQAEEDYTITLGKKIAVIHSKHYIEFGLNLGSQLIEYATVMDVMTAIEEGDVNRLIVPSYLDFLIITLNPQYKGIGEVFKLTNVLDHPFQLGMVLARDSSNLTVTDLKLLSCLRTSISGFEKQERSAIDLSTLTWSEKKEEKTALDNDNLLTLTYYFFMMAAGLICLGLCWDGWNHYKKTRPQHQVAADVENGDNAVTDIHEIPSGGSTPNMEWGAEAGEKYKMSIIPTETLQPSDQVGEVRSRESFPAE